jgi:subtilisin family serine protease
MHGSRIIRSLLIVGIVLGLLASAAPNSGSASVSAQSDGIPPTARFVDDELVVQFRPGLDDPGKGRLLGPLNAARKGAIRKSARDGDLELVSLPPGFQVAEAVRRLHGHPDVRFAEPNFIYTDDETPNDPYYSSNQLWGMYGDATTPANAYGSQAGEAWAAGKVGSDTVYVAVTDHGVRLDHPDLQANIWTNPFDPPDGIDNDGNGYIDDVNGWDFANGDKSVYDLRTQDETDGHATHVAGTIGAVGGNAQGVAGVNWHVKLIVTKYMNDSGGTSANIPRVLDYLIDLKQRHGLNIVASNNSYGGAGFSQAASDAISRAQAANILFVAAAGNNSRSNDATPQYPASYPQENVLSVAALNKDGTLRSTSNWGATSVDLGAPGGEILSTVASGSPLYAVKSGTSMAAPHVTGAVALYAAAFPGASSAQIKRAILDATAPTASLAGKVVSGGRLDIGKLVGAGATGPTSTPTATPAVTASPTAVGTVTVTTTPVATGSVTPTPTATSGASGNHVGDLNGSSAALKKGQWSAEVLIVIHNANHQLVTGAAVSGTYTWSGGTSSGSCTTDVGGGCLIRSTQLPSAQSSVSFSVTQVTPNYVPSQNHDVNGDSTGTTVVVPK